MTTQFTPTYLSMRSRGVASTIHLDRKRETEIMMRIASEFGFTPANAVCSSRMTWLERGTFFGSSQYMGMIKITIEELEVADAAHFMGYDLMRGRDGYVLARKFGADTEVIKASTLKQISEYLKH
jgi:hypothetical protein